MDLVLLFMQLLAAQYCPLPTHRRVEAIANRQPPRPSLGGVRQIDHVAMCGSERSLRSYTIVGVSDYVVIGPVSLVVRLCVISDFRSPSIIAPIF